jgi:hypothetical protein
MIPPVSPEHDPLPALRIVSYSTRTVAGGPAILARCIQARTKHECRCVWPTNRSKSGIEFRGDIQWEASPGEALAELERADLVILTNGRADRRHEPLIREKPVITLARNYPWNVDRSFVRRGFPGAVLGHYQATLEEFRGWFVVPNPLPLWEDEYKPGAKSAELRICYTPNGKHDVYSRNDLRYWHSKGCQRTIATLDRLAAEFPIALETLRDGKRVSHAEALEAKRRSHIVIDECVTGSFHKSSIEGLAAGCVVVNGVGLLAGMEDVLRHCTAPEAGNPFVFSDLGRLPQVLTRLIEGGSDSLLEQGRRNREWMERYWDFSLQWPRFWVEPVRCALLRAGSAKL